MDLRDAQDLALAFAAQFDDDLDPFVALARLQEECGEAAAEVARLERRGSKGASGQAGSVEALADEVADVLINLAGLANTYGFSLAEAMERKRERFIARYGQALVDRHRQPWTPPEADAPLRVTVFCSSSDAVAPAYLEAATALGALLGERRWRLVYGGGSRGLMGAVSVAAKGAGASVHGIILDVFRETGGDNHHVDRLEVVSSMGTRKRGLVEAGDAIIALPGGFGTLEELLEVLSLRQLGIQPRPVILLNTAGFYDTLVAQLARIQAEGFAHPLPPHIDALYHVAASPLEAVQTLATCFPFH